MVQPNLIILIINKKFNFEEMLCKKLWYKQYKI